ncbi:hypothetical protein NQ318_014939 [Aromia moschata]|uniref:DUF4817 domain-containing protein n=1 Tax=Aromia moschata TaxID=1265417 RepID=A0AAV8X3G8_9CUCU|nr:hypothetical protein NQ318_014939 [Aromia moschata]
MILKCFIQNGYNSEAASEAYFNRYPERRQPNMSIFGRLKENLVEYGGFNKPRPKNYRIQDAEDVAINVVGMVVVNPSISSRQIEAESGISRRRALSVLKKHKFRPYTIRKQQQLLPSDPERRLDFCNWYLQQIEQDQLFLKISFGQMKVTADPENNVRNPEPGDTLWKSGVSGSFSWRWELYAEYTILVLTYAALV